MIPESGMDSLPREGNGNPFQYSCLENFMDRGAWQATVHGVTKNWTRLSMHAHTHTHTHTHYALTVDKNWRDENKRGKNQLLTEPLTTVKWWKSGVKFFRLWAHGWMVGSWKVCHTSLGSCPEARFCFGWASQEHHHSLHQ